MQEIPKTFCPAKWDEIFINLDNKLVYSCCKSKPKNFENKNDYNIALNEEKNNLLNGIKDLSCEYCWKVEDKGQSSRRHHYLNNWNPATFSKYIDNKPPSIIEVNLGNECNFQCMYCNPTFSSKWQADVSKKPYTLFSEKFNYAIPIISRTTKEEKFNLIKEFAETADRIGLIGGEPFYIKNFFELIESLNTKHITITTNLSCTTTQLDKLFSLTDKFNKVDFHISLDATGSIAEFVRYGLDFNQIDNNIKYLLRHAPSNYDFQIKSLMTSITIQDLENFKNYIMNFLSPTFKWYLFACRQPEFQSFVTLEDKFKHTALALLSDLTKDTRVVYADTIMSAITASTFNKTLYKQLQIFVQEFALRKNIAIPINL